MGNPCLSGRQGLLTYFCAKPDIRNRVSVPLALPASTSIIFMSREWDLNPRPAVYETAALPLSYLGSLKCYLCKNNYTYSTKNHAFEEM